MHSLILMLTMLASPPERESIRVEQLINALRSPIFQERSDAMAKLKTIGQPAFTLLKQVVQGSNSPEQIWRAKEVLAHIEEHRLDASMLEASLIQLPDGTTTVGDALQLLQKDDNTHFAARDATLFQQTITLPKTTPMLYWEAFATIADSANLHLVDMHPAAKLNLTRLAKPSNPEPLPTDPRLVAIEKNLESGEKTIQPLKAELAAQPTNRATALQNLHLAQTRQAIYQQELSSMKLQIANERQQAKLAGQLLVLDSGPATMTQTFGNLHLSLHPHAKADGMLPLRIAIDSEPGVAIGHVKSIQIDDAIDAQDHALKAETHITPLSEYANVNSTVIMNNGQQILINGQAVINKGPGGQIIVNGPGAITIKEVTPDIQLQSNTQPAMATLSGFSDDATLLKTIRGSMQVPVTRCGIVLQELHKEEQGLRAGDSASQPGIAIKLTQVKKNDTRYTIEFDLKYRPTELDWGTPNPMEIQIGGGVAVIQQRLPQGAWVPSAGWMSLSNTDPTRKDEVVFSDANGVPYKLAIPISRVTRATLISGITHDHITMTLTPTQPDQGPPASVQVIGHRTRTITVPFEFTNPSIGK